METVDAIVSAERDGEPKPLEDQQMKKGRSGYEGL